MSPIRNSTKQKNLFFYKRGFSNKNRVISNRVKKLLAILLFSFVLLNIGINFVLAIQASTCKEYCSDTTTYTPPTGVVCICNPLKATSTEALIDSIVDFIFWFGVALAPLMIIIAGFFFLTAAGEPDKINKAKNIITYTFIGLLIILLAKGLISALKTVLGG
ncbi:hypothetical protein AMJ49_03975 [Parcubacteria bacterium DG_74_2]|nr:MAG: hypothetical protein AMJ49_03975 [Parcubacteria bacterium DG_74_2]